MWDSFAPMTQGMTSAQEWTGPVGDVWAQEWRRTDRSFSDLTAELVPAILAIAPDAGRAIDIGCGAGETAIALAAAKPNLAVTGIDISDGLLAIAQTRAEALPNLHFEAGDAATSAASHAPIDLYISRHGVMFFDDPRAAFTALRAAASDRARLIFSCFRDWSENGFAHAIAALTGDGPPPPDAPGPFAFADKDKVATLLAQSGWQGIEAWPVDFSYVAGATEKPGDDPVADAVSFLRRIGPAARAIRAAPEEQRPALIAALTALCEQHRDGDTVRLSAAAWIWTASA